MPDPPVRAALLAGVLVVVAAGCWSSEASPSASTRAATSTAYVTIPARSTTTTDPPAPAADEDDQRTAEPAAAAAIDDDPSRERTYEIQAGDYLVGIAGDFDVLLDNLITYNGWPDGVRHALVPGEQIRIPPSGYDPDESATTGGTADASPSDGTATGETCPDGEPRETYTIEAGDIPAIVAERLGTTVAELAAANADTVGYRGFVVGIVINVPC